MNGNSSVVEEEWRPATSNFQLKAEKNTEDKSAVPYTVANYFIWDVLKSDAIAVKVDVPDHCTKRQVERVVMCPKLKRPAEEKERFLRQRPAMGALHVDKVVCQHSEGACQCLRKNEVSVYEVEQGLVEYGVGPVEGDDDPEIGESPGPHSEECISPARHVMFV